MTDGIMILYICAMLVFIILFAALAAMAFDIGRFGAEGRRIKREQYMLHLRQYWPGTDEEFEREIVERAGWND